MLNYSDLKQEYRLGDDGDSWGSAMNAFFDVAAELYHREGETPWGYLPGMASDPRDPDSYFAQIAKEAETDALIDFGHLLDRYTDLLRSQGKDY